MKTKEIVKLMLILTLIVGTSYSCTKNTFNRLTYDDFKENFDPDMNYDALVAEFGKPDKDAGSGIHIYVYNLADETEIWIGYVTEILYVFHKNENGERIEILFERMY